MWRGKDQEINSRYCSEQQIGQMLSLQGTHARRQELEKKDAELKKF